MGRLRTPQLIGREHALGQLGAAVDRRSTASGELILLSGEAGIGKTRLIEEFAARHAATRVVVGTCVESAPYAPWAEVLRPLVDGSTDLPPRVRSQLARLLPSIALDEPAQDEGPQLLFESVLELLARHAGLVIVIDDAHWIDAASAELLRYVAGNLRRVPILLVVAYRPEDSKGHRTLLAQLGRLANERISLERLPDDATARIASLLLGEDTAAAAIDRIVRDADGNPLFVEELVAAASTTGIPETLRDLLLARFTILDDDTQHLVRVAAVMGAHASRAWLAQVSQSSVAGPRAAIDAGVLVSDENGYAFRHALLRQAVLDELSPDERVALHRTLADALETHPECALGVDRVGELARHWDAAHEAAPALRWLVQAAQQAQRHYAFEAAHANYERALVWWDVVREAAEVAGIDHAALLLEAAEATGLARHVDRAAELGRAAVDEAFTLDASRGVDAAARVYGFLWTADRALELFELTNNNVLPRLDEVDSRARARFLVMRTQYLVAYAAPAEIRGSAAEMMSAIETIDDPALEARAHITDAWHLEGLGAFAEVEPHYEIAADIARRGGANAMLALALLNHASYKTSVPDLAGALLLLDELDKAIEHYGLRRNFVSGRCTRAYACCLAGNLDAARNALIDVDGLLLEGLDGSQRAINSAMVEVSAGRYDEALAHLADTPNDTEIATRVATLRAEAFAWKGQLREAERAVDEALPYIEHHPEPQWQGWLAMAALRAHADGVEDASATQSLDVIESAEKRALVVIDDWRRTIRSLKQTTPLIEAKTRAIEAEVARIREESVAEAMALAADSFDAISMPYYASYFRWRQASALLKDGNRGVVGEMCKPLLAVVRAHGFAGLEVAIRTLARRHQLRLGAARTTIDGDEALSVRELEVLRLMVDGKNNPEIAESLYISRRTAAAHVSNILKKLGTSTRVEAVSEALRRGYV